MLLIHEQQKKKHTFTHAKKKEISSEISYFMGLREAPPQNVSKSVNRSMAAVDRLTDYEMSVCRLYWKSSIHRLNRLEK